MRLVAWVLTMLPLGIMQMLSTHVLIGGMNLLFWNYHKTWYQYEISIYGYKILFVFVVYI